MTYTSSWILSAMLLALAIVPCVILWDMHKRKSTQDGWRYFLASIAIMLLTAAVLVWTPHAYEALGGPAFMPSSKLDGAFDMQSYSGFLQILFGVPVAIAGSLYAILLARQSERQSSQFNAYEIRKNFRDRLEQRNAVIGRFAKSLRDINNTAYVLTAQTERVIAALPDADEARQASTGAIRKEAGRIESEGLPALRAAFDDYRNATIAVQENGIALSRGARQPLTAIRKHFFALPGQPLPEERDDFVGFLLRRDYQVLADRFLVRTNRLGTEDLIRTHLERLSQLIVRWSEGGREFAWSEVCAVVMGGSGMTDADVLGETDCVGFRFIGPALIRADGCADQHHPRAGKGWTHPQKDRIDFGTAMLLDSYYALPSREASFTAMQDWDEWQFLEGLLGKSPVGEYQHLVPEPAKHFPEAFVDEVQAIQQLYAYTDQDPEESEFKEQAQKARMDYRTLFHGTPPAWLDTAYDRLATQIIGDAPPTKQELVGYLACIAVGIHLSRMNGARIASMEAIDSIAQPMDGGLARQYLKLGAPAWRDLRRSLLVSWAMQPGAAQRTAVVQQLRQLLGATNDKVLTVQLHLDLHDCLSALGDNAGADTHFGEAKALLGSETAEGLACTPWFGRYTYALDVPLEPQLVLLSLWMRGYLEKQPGRFMFQVIELEETEITMPQGFLPFFWYVFVRKGLIHLPDGRAPRLVACKEDCFLDQLIAAGQGDWEWDPAQLATEMDRRLEDARQDSGETLLDQIFDERVAMG